LGAPTIRREISWARVVRDIGCAAKERQMVIWQGGGILALVLPIGAFVLGWTGLDFVMGEAWEKAHPGWVGASLVLSGIAIWFLGRKWNGMSGRVLIDPATKEPVVRKSEHTIFFIPMEYAAIFWIPIGIFLFFNLQ
jgi:hypothetical protein